MKILYQLITNKKSEEEVDTNETQKIESILITKSSVETDVTGLIKDEITEYTIDDSINDLKKIWWLKCKTEAHFIFQESWMMQQVNSAIR